MGKNATLEGSRGAGQKFCFRTVKYRILTYLLPVLPGVSAGKKHFPRLSSVVVRL